MSDGRKASSGPAGAARIASAPPGDPRGWAAAQAGHHARELAALHALHELLHFEELLEQPVDVLHLHAGPGRDSAAPGAIEDLGVHPLATRHRINDRDLPLELAVRYLGRHRAASGKLGRQLVHDRAEAAEFAHL